MNSNPAPTHLQLMAELEPLTSSDELASWALRCLPIKNKLSAPDAHSLEKAFQLKMAGCSDQDINVSSGIAHDSTSATAGIQEIPGTSAGVVPPDSAKLSKRTRVARRTNPRDRGHNRQKRVGNPNR